MSHTTRRRTRVKRTRRKYDTKRSQSRGGAGNAAMQLIMSFFGVKHEYPEKPKKTASSKTMRRRAKWGTPL